MVIENIVFIERGSVEIHVAARNIRGAVFEKTCYHFDIIGDAVRRGFDNLGLFDVQFFAVFKKPVCIEFRDLHNGLMLAFRAFQHLVLARVGIRRKMSDIGYVHRASDVNPRVVDILFKHVFHDVRT